MAVQVILPRALDANGDPAGGAKATFYDTGTTNPQTVYSDTGLTTPHTDPLVADSEGVFPQTFGVGATALKVTLTDSADAALPEGTIDPVPVVSLSASAASSVGFTPTADIPDTNVQDAIEQVQANWTGAKSGSDASIVSGTAGTDGNLGQWNADGDLVNGPDVLDEDDMASDSATAVATQQSIKAYVDGQTEAGLVFLQSVDASTSATIDLTAFDATKYDAYRIVVANLVPDTDATTLLLRTSTDGGSTFDSGASDYEYTFFGTGSVGSTSSSSALLTVSSAVGSAAGEDGCSGEVILYGPHLAKRTIATFHMAYQNTAGNMNVNHGAFHRDSAADVDAVRLLFSSGNAESGTVTLYGMRNA